MVSGFGASDIENSLRTLIENGTGRKGLEVPSPITGNPLVLPIFP